ncbi:DUF3566 domain-containing protein [Mycobacterium avium]|uniref:Uncharacterized protein n=2 Tax=Mycobacterium avium TaxID=1764 RepID=A0A2A3L7G1_MYCAV|nr:DUF3566 domain-containing protein [Mycobacterium avium]ATO60882.2 DUF3566 domain-containing protein [Mycobacterium avium subsp. hominissuis]ATO65444.1 DUF3566 domain-containing protein [Mycobacterium avium subsp. hominissuis]ATO70013.1 DUF3566 domain-containing protein [Mycobacterium avium subsp. hominissuis]MDO2393146.1 DUF3566 domain-containing protein [Mycobacterium avium subsp. hominissuis]PBJ33695.1 hypothetical protein XV03_12255 [Mycobacterium avium subsp. hominissuis]
MSSPNEPGAPKKGETPNGDGSAERAGVRRATPPAPGGRAPEAGDGPPWQRGGTRPQQPPPRQNEPPTEKRAAGGGAEARLNRFISGTASHAKEPERGEGPPAEAYASELPDLSGPVPRGPHRKPAAERGAETTGGQGGGRPVSGESREGRDNRDRVQVSRRTRGPVRASMQIRRIDPWSTLKVSLLLSVALFFVWMIAVAFLYLVLGGMGVWSKLNSNVGDLLNNTSGSSGELVSSGTIFGGAVLIGLVNIVLLTAMATIAAFIYNLATDLIGGIEVTLADRD